MYFNAANQQDYHYYGNQLFYSVAYEADGNGRVVYQYLKFDPYCIDLTI